MPDNKLCANPNLVADRILPMWPTIPIDRPSRGPKTTLDEWALFHRYSCGGIAAVLDLDESLLLATFRKIYGDVPDVNLDGELIISEAELSDCAAALWPEVRPKSYNRRVKGAKALKALQALANK